MTTITAKVIADSISPRDIRLTTLQLRYPKCIHGEAKTHRQLRIADRAYELLEEVGFMDDPNLSRNASSSRAIPVERLIKDVMEDSYVPVHWGKNQRGMQALEECNARLDIPLGETLKGVFHQTGHMYIDRLGAWLEARDQAVRIARAFSDAGYHKQIVNRLLEPWAHINVVVTATEWRNFFALRDHADAQPEIRVLAQAMKKAMAENTPKLLQPGEWHLPYCADVHGKPSGVPPLNDDAIKVSVARCARVSYLTQEGKTPTIEEDLKLYERLIGSKPLHASPAEHQATPDTFHSTFDSGGWGNSELHGNFRGWIQFRKTLKGECQ